MTAEFSRAGAKAGACSYILLSLLQRLDMEKPGLIDELIAGAEGDWATCRGAPDLPPAVPHIFRETLAILTRANAYKQNIAARDAASQGIDP